MQLNTARIYPILRLKTIVNAKKMFGNPFVIILSAYFYPYSKKPNLSSSCTLCDTFHCNEPSKWPKFCLTAITDSYESRKRAHFDCPLWPLAWGRLCWGEVKPQDSGGAAAVSWWALFLRLRIRVTETTGIREGSSWSVWWKQRPPVM